MSENLDQDPASPSPPSPAAPPPPENHLQRSSRLGRLAQGPFFLIALVALVVFCLAQTREYAVPIAVAVLIWFLINAIADGIRALPGFAVWLPAWGAKGLSILVLVGAISVTAQVVADNMVALGGMVDFGPGTLENSAFVIQMQALAAQVGLEDVVRAEALIGRIEIERWIGVAITAARSLVSDVSLVFLYILFLLVDEQFYEAKLRALEPDERRREYIRATLRRISSQTRLYMRLMSLVSAGVAIITYLLCRQAGVEGAGFWGFLAFLLNFIPTIGSILAVVLPGVFAIFTLPDWTVVLVLITLLSVTQFVAGEIVVPRLMGDSLNLSSFVILLALVVWGAMWGPAGMFLAIPLTVILMLIFARFEATRSIAVMLSKDGRLPAE